MSVVIVLKYVEGRSTAMVELEFLEPKPDLQEWNETRGM